MNSRTHETLASNITARSIIVGVVLVIVNVYWVGIASELWYSVFTMENPFSNAIFTLTLLIIFSFALGKLSPKFLLSPSELLVVYAMVTMASTISGHTMMAILLGTLGPLDLSFSCWFLFWVSRAERMLASTMGWRPLYLAERSSGAWMDIGAMSLWVSRRHLIAFVKHLLGSTRMDDSNEPLRYRNASLLFLISFVFLAIFCSFAGMSAWAILVFFVLYYLLAIAIGRIRAELGPPYHAIAVNPRAMMVQMFGARRLGGENLTMLTFLHAFDRRNRAHPMPCEIESLKIGEQAGMDNRRLSGAMGLAIGIGAIATFCSYLQLSYKYGTLTKFRGWMGHFGWESFNPLQHWLQYPHEANMRGIVFMGGGFMYVLFLYAMRMRLFWWPLHPSGYVLSGIAQEETVFYRFPLMVSWSTKATILRYGGLKTHRKASLLFLGLVLGDYIPRSILSIVSLVLSLNMPSSGAGLGTLWGNR